MSNKPKSYQLVNPMIEGTLKDVYEGKKALDAADQLWKNLTEHIVSHVPKFIFTMKELSGGNYHHFEVKEDDKEGSYVINELNLQIPEKEFNNFAKMVDDYSSERNDKEQKGGKRKRYDDSSSSDSDSSSSSSSEYYPTIRRTSPIAMFHYNSRVYYTTRDGNTYSYQSTINPQLVTVRTPVFTPIFRPALGTFVGIWP